MSFTKNLSISPFVSAELAEKAKSALETTPWPTTRMEHWKYTRVSKLQKLNFADHTGTISNKEQYVIDPDYPTVFFVNGHFIDAESDLKTIESDISIKILSEDQVQIENSSLEIKDELFNALNTAYLTDGIEINVAKKSTGGKLQIIHVLSGDTSISNFKTIIHVDDFAEFNVIQGFFSEVDAINCFANISTEVKVGLNSNLSIDKFQYEGEGCFHINSEVVDQKKDSHFTINTITLNGGLVRNNLKINVNGENSTTNLYGAYVLKGKQHVDNHTVVDHKVANCYSNELYKGVIDESATAVFNGKVFVRPDAQKINAFQSNGNVLLSGDASVNSKPELEIYADDVKCSHGSTTGQLDDDAVFYLEARGISKPKAMALLVSAFVGEAFDNIDNENVQQFIHEKLHERFNWEF